jgi:Mg/Co/Ni transporter MgtE
MQSGVPEIQKMYIDLLAEVLGKQQHTSRYPKQTLELLSDSLSNSVRINMGLFDEDASEIIKQEMLTVIDSTSSRKIRNNYRELIEIL